MSALLTGKKKIEHGSRKRHFRGLREAFLGDANVQIGTAMFIADRSGRIKRILPERTNSVSELAPSEKLVKSLK